MFWVGEGVRERGIDRGKKGEGQSTVQYCTTLKLR
jgi:hypothetical protein